MINSVGQTDGSSFYSEPTANQETKKSRRKLWELITKACLEERRALCICIGSLVVLALGQGLLLLMVRGFVQALFGSAAVVPITDLLPDELVTLLPVPRTWQFSRTELTVWVPTLIVAAGCSKAIATFGYQYSQQAFAMRFATDLRRQVFKALIGQSYLAIKAKSPGRWMSIIMNDIMLLQVRVSDLLTGLVRDSVVTISCLLWMFFIHWQTALILVAVAPPVAWLLGRAGRKIAHYAEVVQRELGHLAALTLSLRTRFDFIYASHGTEWERRNFDKVNTRYFNYVRKTLLLRSVFAPALELFGFAAFAVFIALVGQGYWVDGFEATALLQFFVALGLLLKPLRNLGEQLTKLGETQGNLQAVITILGGTNKGKITSLGAESTGKRLKHEMVPNRQVADQRAPPLVGDVDIDHWRVRYDAKDKAVSAGQMSLRPGRCYLIVGASGSGKSTLLKSLAGLIEPEEWQANYSWSEVALNTSLVGQIPFLFSGTLRSNLIYGLEDQQAEDRDLWRSLETVGLRTFAEQHPEGLDRSIGGIDSGVSGGQLQRLTVARAILREKPILLLDEATANLDPGAEQSLMNALISYIEKTQKILIVVTHRLHRLDDYDLIYYFQDGELLLRGTHRELSRSATYLNFINGQG